MELYAWQRKCIESWFSCGCRGIAKVVTGAGKTLMALVAASELEKESPLPLRVKIIVPKAFMIRQWKQSIERYREMLGSFADDIGVYYGDRKDEQDHSCMLYVINSARFVISRHVLDDFQNGRNVLYICDECHHFGSNANRKVFSFLSEMDGHQQRDISGGALVARGNTPRFSALGLSATPENEFFDDFIAKAIGNIFFSYNFGQAIADTVVSRCILYHISLQLEPGTRVSYDALSLQISRKLAHLRQLFPPLKLAHSDTFIPIIQRLSVIDDEQISSTAKQFLLLSQERRRLLILHPERIKAVESLVQSLDEHAKILVYTERIDQCEALYARFSMKDANRVSHYHSQLSKETRHHNLRAFQEDRTRILVCCKALDEGLDIPSVDVGIVLSCSSQERQRIQRLGRILRQKEGKTLSALYYFYFQNTVERHTVVDRMQDDEGMDEFFLAYHPEERSFEFPAYETVANQLLSATAEHKGLEAAQVLLPYLDTGKLRTDWLLPVESIEAFASDETLDSRQHNYFLVMLLLARTRMESIRQEGTSH